MELPKIYGVPAFAKNIKEPLAAHCFGDCGKISIGGMIQTGDLAGPCWTCRQEQCPYEVEAIGPVGVSPESGEELFIRVIQMEATDTQPSTGEI